MRGMPCDYRKWCRFRPYASREAEALARQIRARGEHVTWEAMDREAESLPDCRIAELGRNVSR